MVVGRIGSTSINPGFLLYEMGRVAMVLQLNDIQDKLKLKKEKEQYVSINKEETGRDIQTSILVFA